MDEPTEALARRLAEEAEMWFGQPATASDIAAVEARLGLTIPASYRSFLMTFGIGGAPDAHISGIFRGEPYDDGVGTILGDTLRLRDLMGMPGHLLVVRNGDDEVPWCLDTTTTSESGEPPMVSFDGIKPDALYPNFDAFFAEYLRLFV